MTMQPMAQTGTSETINQIQGCPLVFSGIFYSDEKPSDIKGDFYISISNCLIPVYINLVITNSWGFAVSLVDSIQCITPKSMSANKNYLLSPSSQAPLAWLESVTG